MAETSVRNEKGVEEESFGFGREPEEGLRERFLAVGDFLKKGSAGALAVLFVVGALFGVAAKTLAGSRITMGYWDYTVSSRDREAVDLNALEKRLAVKREEEKKRQEAAQKAAEEAAQKSGKDAGASGEVPEGLPPLPPVPEPPAIPGEAGE